jgi:hypothetical protein
MYNAISAQQLYSTQIAPALGLVMDLLEQLFQHYAQQLILNRNKKTRKTTASQFQKIHNIIAKAN